MFDFLLAPFVVARRLEKAATQSSLANTAADEMQKAMELNRMVVEKMAAFQLGMLESSAAALRSTSVATTRMLSGDTLGAAIAVADAPRKMVSAGLAPASSILRANVRRLSAN